MRFSFVHCKIKSMVDRPCAFQLYLDTIKLSNITVENSRCLLTKFSPQSKFLSQSKYSLGFGNSVSSLSLVQPTSKEIYDTQPQRPYHSIHTLLSVIHEDKSLMVQFVALLSSPNQALAFQFILFLSYGIFTMIKCNKQHSGILYGQKVEGSSLSKSTHYQADLHFLIVCYCYTDPIFVTENF